MNRKDIIKNRIINPNDFIGKIFYPSLSVKSSFLKLFILFYSDFSKYFILNSIMWDRDKFKVNIISIESKIEYNIFFTDNNGINGKCNGVFCTSNICSGIHNNDIDNNLKKFLLNFVVKGKKIKFENLLIILSNDFKAKRDYYKIFWKGEVPPYSIINDWGEDIHKVRFCLNENIIRDLDHTLEFNIPEIFIHHSERECLGINPNKDDPKKLYRFFNYNDDFWDHTFDKYFYLTDDEKSKLKVSNNLERITDFTDLNEDDVIMGNGNDKLEKIMKYADKVVKEKDLKLVSFNCTCISRIIGDDIYSILNKAKDKLTVPFLFEGQLEKTPFESRIEMLDEYLNEIDRSKYSIKSKTIALFGYHQNKYLKILNNVFIDNEIKINLIFVPMIDIKLLPALFESELFVFSNNKHYDEIFEYPFKYLCDNKFISPKNPIGINNTDLWFSQILNKFGLVYKRSDYNEKIVSEYDKKVDIIKNNKYKVGFVFTGLSDLQLFLKSSYTNDIDVIGFLQDMGFFIEFFIFDSFDSKKYIDKFSSMNGNHNLIIKEIDNKFINKENYNINFISTENEMYNSIENSSISIIYSDIYFDERVLRMGLAQFNLSNFKLGYVGALETVSTLLKLCRMNYFKDFRKYF